MSEQIMAFLNKPLITLNGFQLTTGIALLAVAIYLVVWRNKK